MNQISAAENHIIHIRENAWRLSAGERPLAQATPEGLQYVMRFGTTRRLPPARLLRREDMQQVVLGWQQRDEAWHLGVVLSSQLAATRGSRWCELAYWPDPDRDVFDQIAQQAGQKLADTLQLPFVLIPQRRPAPAPPPPPLPSLPLQASHWTLERFDATQYPNIPGDDRSLIFVRSRRWQTLRLSRIGWHTLWAIVYAVLSIATLTSDLALPNAGTLLPDPHLLPYLGLIISAGLVVSVIYNLYRMLTVPGHLLLDVDNRTLSAWRGGQRWQVTADEVQSVYVSEVVKRKSDDPVSEHGEINLHRGDGDFVFVLKQGEPEPNKNARESDHPPDRSSDAVLPLTRETVETDLQAMALYLAEALGNVPAWYDMRVR